MFKTLWYKILSLFGVKTRTTDKEYTENEGYAREYSNIRNINFNAIFSNKLANFVCNESNINLDEDNKRAEFLNNFLKQVWDDRKKIVSRMLGIGAVVVVPYVSDDEMFYNIIPQNRLSINEKKGQKIVSATILADIHVESNVVNNKSYYRWTDYKIDGDNLKIEQRYTTENGEKIEKPEIWKDVNDKIIIPNVDRVPFGFFKSPIDNRKSDDNYGVPITYGCGKTIEEIYKCLEQIAREFELKEAFVGADFTLFKKSKDSNVEELPRNGLFKLFNSSKNDDDMFEVFDPAIRDSSYYARLQELYSRLEKEIGVSAGFLTQPETKFATATEIKQGMYDTFVIVGDTRQNFEKGMADLLYACDILANFYNLTPMGEYEITYDWSYELLENSGETFNQLMAGNNQGVVSKLELRQFLFPNEDLDTAKKQIEEIKKEEPKTDELLGE